MTAFIGATPPVSLLIPVSGPTITAGARAQESRPSALVRASTTQQPADGGWPRAYVTSSGARLVFYEPQVASWLDQKRTAMYAAVSYAAADRNSTASNVPTLSRDPLTSVVSADVTAALGAQHAGVSAGAPTVFVSKTPAELMPLNGGAAYTPVKGTHLEWVSNTGSDVFRLRTTDTVYYVASSRRFSSPGFSRGFRGGGGFRAGRR
jgi:hypothetical protein